jgi:hypothetical protein
MPSPSMSASDEIGDASFWFLLPSNFQKSSCPRAEGVVAAAAATMARSRCETPVGRMRPQQVSMDMRRSSFRADESASEDRDDRWMERRLGEVPRFLPGSLLPGSDFDASVFTRPDGHSSSRDEDVAEAAGVARDQVGRERGERRRSTRRQCACSYRKCGRDGRVAGASRERPQTLQARRCSVDPRRVHPP